MRKALFLFYLSILLYKEIVLIPKDCAILQRQQQSDYVLQNSLSSIINTVLVAVPKRSRTNSMSVSREVYFRERILMTVGSRIPKLQSRLAGWRAQSGCGCPESKCSLGQFPVPPGTLVFFFSDIQLIEAHLHQRSKPASLKVY